MRAAAGVGKPFRAMRRASAVILGRVEDPIVFWIVLMVLTLLGWRTALWRPRGLPGVSRNAPLLIGHRGVRPIVGEEDLIAGSSVEGDSDGEDGPAENTIEAFRAALDAGLDGVECDVQRTRDGELVLYHDQRLGDLVVTGSTLAELRAVEPKIPLLSQLLDVAKRHPGTLLNLEIKLYGRRGRGIERQLVQQVRAHNLIDRVLVSSFQPLSLARLRLIAPEVRTGLLFAPNLPRLLRSGGLAGWLHVDALHPHHGQVTPSLLRTTRSRGLLVNAWTVNDDDEVKRLVELGVSGIIADDPAALKRAAGR